MMLRLCRYVGHLTDLLASGTLFVPPAASAGSGGGKRPGKAAEGARSGAQDGSVGLDAVVGLPARADCVRRHATAPSPFSRGSDGVIRA